MRFEQSYIPKEPYCLFCGKETKEETCSDNCSSRLTKLRFAIKERKEIEVLGLKIYDEQSIKKFNRIQAMLSMGETK